MLRILVAAAVSAVICESNSKYMCLPLNTQDMVYAQAPTGETVMENALAAVHFATTALRWPLDSIKVFGRSIGTGPAVTIASLFRIAGLILVTPFLSVQELFRDRVGPLAGLVEEWFANKEAAPRITSPTLIIHGQRDELISCRHGESLYELLRSRKQLVSPPEMQHNTNLLTNLQFFVLPMFQFFALPDYVFQDMVVPDWAYDKRRSPFYSPESPEPSLFAQQASETEPKETRPQPPKLVRYAKPLIAQAPMGRRTAASIAKPPPQPTQGSQTPSGPVSREFSRDQEDVVSKPPKESDQATQDAIRKLEEFAGRICANEVCSDGLCTVQDEGVQAQGKPSSKQRQQQILQQIVHARHVVRRQRHGDMPATPHSTPRLLHRLHKDNGGWKCPESVDRWCGKRHPWQNACLTTFEGSCATNAVLGRCCGMQRSTSAIDVIETGNPLHTGLETAEPGSPRTTARRRANKDSENMAKVPSRAPLFSACCSALPSDPLMSLAPSQSLRPAPFIDEEFPARVDLNSCVPGRRDDAQDSGNLFAADRSTGTGSSDCGVRITRPGGHTRCSI